MTKQWDNCLTMGRPVETGQLYDMRSSGLKSKWITNCETTFNSRNVECYESALISRTKNDDEIPKILGISKNQLLREMCYASQKDKEILEFLFPPAKKYILMCYETVREVKWIGNLNSHHFPDSTHIVSQIASGSLIWIRVLPFDEEVHISSLYESFQMGMGIPSKIEKQCQIETLTNFKDFKVHQRIDDAIKYAEFEMRHGNRIPIRYSLDRITQRSIWQSDDDATLMALNNLLKLETSKNSIAKMLENLNIKLSKDVAILPLAPTLEERMIPQLRNHKFFNFKSLTQSEIIRVIIDFFTQICCFQLTCYEYMKERYAGLAMPSHPFIHKILDLSLTLSNLAKDIHKITDENFIQRKNDIIFYNLQTTCQEESLISSNFFNFILIKGEKSLDKMLIECQKWRHFLIAFLDGPAKMRFLDKQISCKFEKAFLHWNSRLYCFGIAIPSDEIRPNLSNSLEPFIAKCKCGSSDLRIWICAECHEILNSGGGRKANCRCGREDFNRMGVKCFNDNHGNEFCSGNESSKLKRILPAMCISSTSSSTTKRHLNSENNNENNECYKPVNRISALKDESSSVNHLSKIKVSGNATSTNQNTTDETEKHNDEISSTNNGNSANSYPPMPNNSISSTNKYFSVENEKPGSTISAPTTPNLVAITSSSKSSAPEYSSSNANRYSNFEKNKISRPLEGNSASIYSPKMNAPGNITLISFKAGTNSDFLSHNSSNNYQNQKSEEIKPVSISHSYNLRSSAKNEENNDQNVAHESMKPQSQNYQNSVIKNQRENETNYNNKFCETPKQRSIISTDKTSFLKTKDFIYPMTSKHSSSKPSATSITKEDPLPITPKTDPHKAEHLKSINIVILGQSGVGKSTLLNAIANYLRFETSEDALRNDLEFIIPCQFKVFYDDFSERLVSIGMPDANEQYDSTVLSTTQECKEHSFIFKHHKINFIDTPGLSDTDGIEKDARNLEKIRSFICSLDSLHGICFVVKANEARMDVGFSNSMRDLLSIFPKSALPKVLFFMTHSRSTLFGPGDTMKPLMAISQNLLKTKGETFPLNAENIFCVDNESFLYLCAKHNSLEYPGASLEDFENSWKKSKQATQRFFSKITTGKPFVTVEIQFLDDLKTVLQEQKEIIDRKPSNRLLIFHYFTAKALELLELGNASQKYLNEIDWSALKEEAEQYKVKNGESSPLFSFINFCLECETGETPVADSFIEKYFLE